MNYIDSFINNLKRIMENEKLSQDKIAEIAQIRQSTVSRWLSKIQAPTLHNLVKLSEHFDISLDELLGLREFKT